MQYISNALFLWIAFCPLHYILLKTFHIVCNEFLVLRTMQRVICIYVLSSYTYCLPDFSQSILFSVVFVVLDYSLIFFLQILICLFIILHIVYTYFSVHLIICHFAFKLVDIRLFILFYASQPLDLIICT